MVEETLTLAEVIGRNCKAIRQDSGLTQDELARSARRLGLRWTASSVGDFEAARSSPGFVTLLVLAMALQHATGSVVTISDLVLHQGVIELNDSLRMTGLDLAEFLERGVMSFVDSESAARESDSGSSGVGEGRSQALVEFESRMGVTMRDLTDLLHRSGVAERRLAKQLGVDLQQLSLASFRLWGNTFSEERDQQAGSDANQQKRGRVSRRLREELRGELENGKG
ncbi:MAG: helix-turn-helix transcriptional regulator [Mycolicibacterium neoaurum]|uniref:helix-turn-helix domain-containing protein n=1 Tax=Mycolicibacterium neoaurum TaxID=1795 RepID=UPI002FFBE241